MKIKFRMAAWCAAAGRQYNEDNFQLKDNLSNPGWGVINTDNLTSLDEKGALLVVCDGMGGMNAGEVASDLAIKVMQEQFAAGRLTPQVLATPETIMRHIEKAIIAADEKIKEDGKENKEHEGMGSTIVLAWIVEQNVYIGWCGDSRAYRFNPAFGLEQLSHDHSYVQELVDSGQLLPELAFDHPNNNIVTRSLGDSSKKLRPDVKCFPLRNEDIILLCSDGLSGVLRDNEIEDVMSKNTGSMENCRKALWSESEKAGWTDNVTIALCQIVSGAETAPKDDKQSAENNGIPKKKKWNKTLFIPVLVVLLLGVVFEMGYKVGTGDFYLPKLNMRGENNDRDSQIPLEQDSITPQVNEQILDEINGNRQDANTQPDSTGALTQSAGAPANSANTAAPSGRTVTSGKNAGTSANPANLGQNSGLTPINAADKEQEKNNGEEKEDKND